MNNPAQVQCSAVQCSQTKSKPKRKTKLQQLALIKIKQQVVESQNEKQVPTIGIQK